VLKSSFSFNKKGVKTYMKFISKILWGLIIASITGCTLGEPPSPHLAKFRASAKTWIGTTGYGELYTGATLLYVPNMPRNQYKWYGSVQYDKHKTNMTSPHFAMHWKTLKPEGGSTKPTVAGDVVTFELRYSAADDTASIEESYEFRNLRPLPSVLPFKTGGMEVEIGPRTHPEVDPDWKKNSPYYLVAKNVQKRAIALFHCSPIEFSGESPPVCYGSFYPRKGLYLTFQVAPAQLAEWPALLHSFDTLLQQWEKKPNDDTSTVSR
jgi:hypothetical protein